MEKLTERVLIEVLGDKELDVFGIYKKRKQKEEQKKIKQEIIIQTEKQKRKNVEFIRTMTKRLINIYGKEKAIPYLRVLFNLTKLNLEVSIPTNPKGLVYPKENGN